MLIAPTAGGKTEAAILPLLSRMLTEDWRGLSVLYICPIKALLNNLEARLAQYAELCGRCATLWHGDVGSSARTRILSEPPDILLTTPESLEVMLTSNRIDHRNLFAGVRTIVVDEIHAFAGDDRGWHLLAVIERIAKVSTATVQRLGLSATVGNPDRLLEWLTAGREPRGRVIAPPPTKTEEPDVTLDYVGSVANAALVVSRLHRGEKRLVFCDSRSQVELLARELRALSVTTYVSHSSLSLDERRQAETAFSEGSSCVIVATSTLELGIDVGDLDRVIQIDAPGTVAAFLQRLGRTGRRAGTRRNCLFLATREETLLQAAALLKLWHEGYVEPIEPPELPLHVLAQQILALTLQESEMGRSDWQSWMQEFMPAANVDQEKAFALEEHLFSAEFLFSDSGVVSLGRAAEKAFGQKNFLALFSVFDAPPLIEVLHGRIELGYVHPISLQRPGEEQPVVLSLGGRSWRLRYIDWKGRKAFVEPTDLHGRSRWSGSSRPLGFEMCQAARHILHGSELPIRLSRRASEALQSLLDCYPETNPDETMLLEKDSVVEWWTYGGGLLNGAVASWLSEKFADIGFDNYAVWVKGTSARIVDRSLEDLSEEKLQRLDVTGHRIKFSECVPESLRAQQARARFWDECAWSYVMARKRSVIRNAA